MPKGIYVRKNKKAVAEKSEKKVVEKTAASAETPRIKRKYTRKADKVATQPEKMSRADLPKETEAGLTPEAVAHESIGHDILTGVVVDQTLQRLHALASLMGSESLSTSVKADLNKVAERLTSNLKDLTIPIEVPKLNELVDEIKRIAEKETKLEAKAATVVEEKTVAPEEPKVVLPKKMNGAAPVPVEALPAPVSFIAEETKSEA